MGRDSICFCDSKNLCHNSDISKETPKELDPKNYFKAHNKGKKFKSSLQINSKITEFLCTNNIEENQEENNVNTAKNTNLTNNPLTNRSNIHNNSGISNITFETIKINNNISEIIKDNKNEENIFGQMSIIEENEPEKKLLYAKTSKNSLNDFIRIFKKDYKNKKINININNIINHNLGKEQLIYLDGEQCQFNGDLKDKKKINGIGAIYFPNGKKYKGNFINGKLNGEGKYIDGNGNIYEGTFINGELNGNGKIIKIKEEDDMNSARKLINKITYTGNIQNFKREGFGKEICTEYIYEGNYHNDMRNGKGKIKFINTGDSYEGDFLDDKITGYGEYIWSNKQKYIGNFIDGMMNGKGKYTWPDGKEYEGEYINDKREGQGKFKWKNGDIFEGTFHDGKPNGKGIMIYKGSKYKGEFVKGHFKIFNHEKE